ncbi:DEAD/DEAH box helicase [Gottschalkiaceae bacterium SANA]|nr:DEAD/DEAH box helicase [Gottschalkiaceae bacterium SANA]
MISQDLKINPSILKAVDEQNYKKATPIQEKAIPIVLSGKDLLACAQTGTGKTAAFALPILHMLSKEWGKGEDFHPIRALVLAPTRELALQIGDSFKSYGQYLKMQTAVVYGGVPINRNIKALKREPSILVATPGRLLDLIDEGMVDLDRVEFLVLDEADRMLDLGMIQDVKAILSSLPAERQNLLFSATLPDEISKLSTSILKNPARVEVKGKPVKKAGIKQKLYYVDEPDKISLLLYLLKDQSFDSVLVFVRTKKKADQVLKAIQVANISVGVIHGDKNQTDRVQALSLFKKKEIRVLVATDVAARGIDIDRLSHVVNLNIPAVSETYIHRIGRTGRAGMSGIAISFCNNQEIPRLKAIEKLQGIELACVEEHPYVLYNIAIKQSREKYREKPMSKDKPKKRNEKPGERKRSEKSNDRKKNEKANGKKRNEKSSNQKKKFGNSKSENQQANRSKNRPKGKRNK